MYSFSQESAHLASSLQNDHYRQESTNEPEQQHDEYNFRSTEVQEAEEEEPILALDLRIKKASESISIFEAQNVLEYTSSAFGPTLPRLGQQRLPTTPTSPYTLPDPR
jgi:hypothetical protein